MEQRNVNLILWLPEHLKELPEFKEMCRAEDAELRLLWNRICAVSEDMDMYGMSERMCERWERFFKIRNTALMSLDDRRQLIRGYFSSQLPYTLEKLRSTLDSMCGADFYNLIIEPGGQKVTVEVKLVSLYAVPNVIEVVRQMIPAHYELTVKVLYNRWSRFEKMTWGDLKAETWGSLYGDKKWQEIT